MGGHGNGVRLARLRASVIVAVLIVLAGSGLAIVGSLGGGEWMGAAGLAAGLVGRSDARRDDRSEGSGE